MKIETKVLRKWKQLKQHGDYSAIAIMKKFDYRAVSLAFDKKECSEEVYTAIDAFYKERENRTKA